MLGLLKGKPCPQDVPGGVNVGVGLVAARQAFPCSFATFATAFEAPEHFDKASKPALKKPDSGLAHVLSPKFQCINVPWTAHHRMRS
jgi:hypothetical protein